MPKINFVLPFLVLVITSQGFVNAQTRTPSQRDAKEQWQTTEKVQPEPPLRASVERYKQQYFEIVPSPDDAKRFYKQGVKYGQMKLYNEAVAAFELAALLKPNYEDAYFGLGNTYCDMGRWRDASRAFRRVIQLNPGDDKAYARLREIDARLASEKKATLKTSVIQSNTPTAASVKLESNSQSSSARLTRPKYATKIPGTPLTDSSSSLLKQPISQAAKAKDDLASKPTPTRLARRSLTPSKSQPAPSNPSASGSTSGTASAKWTPLKSMPLSVASGLESNANEISETASSTLSNSGSKIVNTTATVIKQADTAESKTSAAVASKTSALPSGASSASAATADKEPAVPTPTVSAVDSRSSSVEATEASETANYRVGVGDVLEIRVTDSPVDTPTLFTVSVSGLLDYPVLSEPLKVLGLTTNEVGERLGNELKRRALSDKQVLVGVSEYNSHRILISGLVNEHGTKILRREAIPLYVVLADAHPLPEAGVVTVISLDRKITTVDLATPLASELLIRHGDVVMVQANPKLLFYVGGEVKAPGEKTLRQGLKLTQAILLAGGLTRVCRTVELAREGTNGRLELSVYKLYDINSGKLPDPPIQAGDRITIVP